MPVIIKTGQDFMPGASGVVEADSGMQYDFMPGHLVEKERQRIEREMAAVTAKQEAAKKAQEKIKAEVEALKKDPELRKQAEELLEEAAEREGLTTEELKEVGELPNPDKLPDAEEVEKGEAVEVDKTYTCECGFQAKSKAGLAAHMRSDAHKEAMASKE